MSDYKKNGGSDSAAQAIEGEESHCQCTAPKCVECGQAIRRPTSPKDEPSAVDIISKIEDVEDVMTKFVTDAEIAISEVRRVINFVSKSFCGLVREDTMATLSQLTDNDAVIRCLCQEVGPNNMEPLISFIEFLTVESEHKKRALALACIEVLKKHQNTVEGLSPCIECTSPATTPTRPPFLIGSKTFYLFGSISKVSPSPSPPSGNSPVAHLNILPSDILKFAGNGQSSFDMDS